MVWYVSIQFSFLERIWVVVLYIDRVGSGPDLVIDRLLEARCYINLYDEK